VPQRARNKKKSEKRSNENVQFKDRKQNVDEWLSIAAARIQDDDRLASYEVITIR